MTKKATPAQIESILASLNRSADTLQCASRHDTIQGAQRNIQNCLNWMKERNLEYHYIVRKNIYTVETGEVESGNNQT